MTDIQDYLNKGMYESPQLKPEEKARYLGNFLERCYCYVEYKDRFAPNLLSYLENILATQEGTLLLHMDLASDLQNQWIQLAQKANRPFTLVQGQTLTSNCVILVYATKQAVHVPQPQFQAEVAQPKVETAEKKSFWQKLFAKK